MEPLCLRCAVQHVPTVLGPFERKGFELVGLKTRGGGALIALRGPADAIAAGRELVAALLASELPAGATVLASASLTEALDWMHDVLGGPREVVQWQDPDEAGYWLRAEGDLAPSGAHNDNRECFRLADLMHAPGEDGGGAGARFCAQLRRDSYVPILVPAEQRALLEAVESGAAQWFALPEDDKYEQGGAYGHVDRKFTGYRAGKFREQLEVRQTIGHTHGGLYPMPTAPPPFGEELRSLIYFLDGTARSLLRHIAVDVGADDGFFESLLDAPPPPLPTGAKAKAKAEAKAKAKAKAKAQADVDAEAEADAEADAPPALGHSLIRLCRYDAESEGVGGGNVLCEEHNDVRCEEHNATALLLHHLMAVLCPPRPCSGTTSWLSFASILPTSELPASLLPTTCLAQVGFITLDACASTAGLEVYRYAHSLESTPSARPTPSTRPPSPPPVAPPPPPAPTRPQSARIDVASQSPSCVRGQARRRDLGGGGGGAAAAVSKAG